jgi:hypothetical protein
MIPGYIGRTALGNPRHRRIQHRKMQVSITTLVMLLNIKHALERSQTVNCKACISIETGVEGTHNVTLRRFRVTIVAAEKQ